MSSCYSNTFSTSSKSQYVHCHHASAPPLAKNVSSSNFSITNSIEVIRVPDISPTAFNIMIDYIYSNFDIKSAELNDDNVMHTLYAG